MPTIEVLPSRPGASAGAGWAYTTLPPANAVSGSLPSSTGGRGARNRHSNFENTAARQRQINSRISDLEKDNYRDAHIPLPKKESGARGASSSLPLPLVDRQLTVNSFG
jgi:zinc finger HIT domain-containing protein 1